MGSKRMSGITIEIDGNTSKLKSSLKSVDEQLSKTQSALRDVNKLLKFDPKNSVLLAQKQTLLASAIEDTEERLKTLRQALKSDLPADQFDALQREIIETEQKLESLNKQANSMKGFGKISADCEEFGNKAKSASDKLQPLSAGAAALGTAMFATVPATEELRTDLSKLDANAKEAGAGIDVARKAFKAFNVVSDETDSSVEATSNLLQAGFTESNLQKAVEGLSGAYLRFPDTLKIESLADSLQETLATGKATGQFGELLDRLGIGADNFSEGLALCSTQAEKQNYALQVLAEAGLMDTYDAWKDNNKVLVEGKEANADMQESLAELGNTLAPIVTKVTKFVTTFINGFNKMPSGAKATTLAIIGLTAAIAPVLSMVGSASLGFSALSGMLSGTSISVGLLSSSFLPIAGIIAGVVAAGVLLYKNWDTIKEKAEELGKWIDEKWTLLEKNTKEKWNNMKNTVSEKAQNIKQKAFEAAENARKTGRETQHVFNKCILIL